MTRMMRNMTLTGTQLADKVGLLVSRLRRAVKMTMTTCTQSPRRDLSLRPHVHNRTERRLHHLANKHLHQ